MEASVLVKDVFTISEQNKRGSDESGERWTKIGIGFVNRDNSINIVLDANPVNGRLHIRDRRSAQSKNSYPSNQR